MKNLKIKNQSQNKAELYIYGDIISGDWKWEDSDVTSTEIRDFLKSIDNVTELDIYVNSAGGDVFTGMAIYNMLKRHKATKTVHVDGLAGSIASVIAMAGDKIIIPSNAYLMIHKAWSGTWGNANELRQMADTLDKIDEGILNVYQGKIKDGIEIDTIKSLVDSETWMTGPEASNYFNIEVGEEVKVAACSSDYFKNYKHVPEKLEEDSQVEDTNIEDEELELMEMELETSSFLI
jgi:ATP-dependent Clp protease, protease subunit